MDDDAGGETVDARTGTLLRLLQLADSGFPTGAFAFSHGLEGLVAAGLVRDEADVRAVVRAQVVESLAGIEAPAMLHAHRRATAADLPALVALDALLAAMKPVPAFRQASAKVGRRLLASAAAIVAGPVLAGYRDAAARGEADGHHAIAYGVVMEAAGVAPGPAAVAFGAGFVQGLAAAAVRLGVIGQQGAQRIVAALHPEVAAALDAARTMPLEEMGAYLPLIDVAGLRQPSLAGRIFGS